MQGLRKTKLISLFIIPLIAACTSPQPTGISDSSRQYPLTQPTSIDNCSTGCPLGGGTLTLHRQAYTLNNNGSTKFANWVAYKITKNTFAIGRPRNWKTDPDVPADETLSPVDYRGANAALKMDRGHQANLASMGGVSDWQTLNYLTNITPQKSDLNQGAWARLEDQERNLSKKTEVDTVYVTTGPLYEKNMGSLPGTNKDHTIPSGYWKVIFTGSTPADGLYAAFIMEQDTPRSANFCDFQVTVNEIERRSGLTLWNGLPQELQTKLKSEKGRLSQKIGCSAMGVVSSR